MESFNASRRQIIIALFAMTVIMIVGVAGFMIIEGDSLLDATWITVTTLTTIGYGDVVAHTVPARIFTIFLIFAGLSVFAFGLQATASFFLNPGIRDLRRQRQMEHKIASLSNHYVICGDDSELVDESISDLIQRAMIRQQTQRDIIFQRLDRTLNRVLRRNSEQDTSHPFVRTVITGFLNLFHRGQTLLDIVVVVTPDPAYAQKLREQNLLVVEGETSEDDVLELAGIDHAYALVVMLDNDTEALLTVLSGRNHNPKLYITAATLEEDLADKMLRVGANSVITPYEVAGQFLNNATLRPAVNDFFTSFLFSNDGGFETTQLYLYPGAAWIGKPLRAIDMRQKYLAGIIGLQHADGSFTYTPPEDYVIQEYDILVVVAPGKYIPVMRRDCDEGVTSRNILEIHQRLAAFDSFEFEASRTYSIMEAETAIQSMSQHYVIAGSSRIAQNAISKLNPERPFVIISDSNAFTAELIQRGFRVIHGTPTSEEILRKAQVDKALAIMVAIDDKADSILTVLTCRTLSQRLLITASANNEEMITKLKRAGADRMASPLKVAAQFVLLATTRPAVSKFFQHVLFNYDDQIETTELYMQDNSPWIGKSLKKLALADIYQAGVIGIRHTNGDFIYAPPNQYIVQDYDVLIVVTPMNNADLLRMAAHGNESKRPHTLRRTSTLPKTEV